ncbi:MAG: RimK family alpha-L-glutamate ligase [Halobacteriovoraceae bacterium]|nr:RimK family alpha-L-glutamate ligase [Halobacteriovoraceae bacterium]
MNQHLVVIEKKHQSYFENSQIQCITPMAYLLEDTKTKKKVYNLSSQLGYQDLGYYVSLLAAARNHKVLPSVQTIQDLKDRRIQKLYSEELHELIQTKLKKIKSDTFELSIYFGKNLTESYNKLAWNFYRIIQAPLFRVYLKRENEWTIQRIKLLSFESLIESHKLFCVDQLTHYVRANKKFIPPKSKYYFDLAILIDKEEKSPPSDEEALKKFISAFRDNGFQVYLIEAKEMVNVSEYDALFIRETTNVKHHTYRLAAQAAKEGLVVIDDPESILKCSNKIFLEQLLERLHVKRPVAKIYDSKLFNQHAKNIALPCIIKKPDSAFSMGVYKAKTFEQLESRAQELFKSTDLILVQEYLPSEYDWRVGILGGEVLYVCKYYMADGHWQIINNDKNQEEGNSAALDPTKVNHEVIKTALKAANAIGDGLYGVDLKEIDGEVYLIEVNDNPSIESGVEDEFIGDELYDKIAKHFLKLCQKKKGNHE